MVTRLADNVYWVGVVDWDIRRFHGHEFSTHHGTTYNAYLIVDEQVALVDTVWGPFQERLIENIREVIDPARINLVVANHAEPDHSGGLPAVMRHAPHATLAVSKRGMESIPGHYHAAWPLRSVTTGERISLGRCGLTFIEAPMLHWPDSMFTYVDGPNLLLSNDAFGQHYASAGRFNDEVDQGELYTEALKYYANILTPFSQLVEKKIAEFSALSLPVAMIAPSHGVIWRHEPLQIVKQYAQWAAQVPQRSAVILYDTMWGATGRMAQAIGEGLAAEGVPFKLFHMGVSDRNDALSEVFKAHAVVLGSPTLNGGLLPTIRPLLEDLRGLRFKNKIGAAFGSYGWGGESVAILEAHLAECKIPIVAPGVRVKWQPDAQALAACVQLGRAVAAGVKAEAAV